MGGEESLASEEVSEEELVCGDGEECSTNQREEGERSATWK